MSKLTDPDRIDLSDLPSDIVDAAKLLERWHQQNGIAHWALMGICSRNNEVARIKLREIARAWRLEATQYGRQVEEARTKGLEHAGMLSRQVTLNGCAQAVQKVLE